MQEEVENGYECHLFLQDSSPASNKLSTSKHHQKRVFGVNMFAEPPLFVLESFKDTTIILLLVCCNAIGRVLLRCYWLCVQIMMTNTWEIMILGNEERVELGTL